MVSLAPDAHQFFFQLITKFYKFINEKDQEIYKKEIKEAIYNFELVCIIENQLLLKEKKPDLNDKHQAYLFCVLSMQAVRRSLDCFRSGIIYDVANIIDAISYILSSHYHNISVLCDNE